MAVSHYFRGRQVKEDGPQPWWDLTHFPTISYPPSNPAQSIQPIQFNSTQSIQRSQPNPINPIQ